MKNIIIGGTVRSGKTTLANLLRQKYGYSKVESDTIVNAFDKVFPEFGITHKNAELTRKMYEPFLHEVLNGFCKDLKFANNVTVFPGAQFLPSNLANYPKLQNYIVVFLGLDNIDPNQLLLTIRANDKETDWTYSKTDEWLLRFCKNVVEESNALKQECQKYGFYYFNTFSSREQVLEEICEIINSKQN